ncbi:hypothetical protein [Haloimpatiens lingqiaonensis]|uniref:hypothetical protein n=1 Tax=Haloimpatiens lingqiaonensis TaxID=1380675 RepID=UPI0010FDEC1E|nr:hypothetical protein [Haloimpatiens lingqiaonensis]
MVDLSKMSKDEQMKKLQQLQEYLEDVEDERTQVLSQRGIHLSSKMVKKYEIEINEIKKSISDLEQLIGI